MEKGWPKESEREWERESLNCERRTRTFFGNEMKAWLNICPYQWYNVHTFWFQRERKSKRNIWSLNGLLKYNDAVAYTWPVSWDWTDSDNFSDIRFFFEVFFFCNFVTADEKFPLTEFHFMQISSVSFILADKTCQSYLLLIIASQIYFGTKWFSVLYQNFPFEF